MLVRIRWSDIDGRLAIGIGPGRGAWLHPDSDCAAPTDDGPLGRALRTTILAGQVPELLEHWLS